MKKVPFNLESWLADKSQKVVTADGHSARIICTDAKSTGENPDRILALISADSGFENALFYTRDGWCLSDSTQHRKKDLFLVTDEPELTEFEKELATVIGFAISQSVTEPDTEMFDFVKCWSERLLSIARKQIEKECWDKFQKATNSELDWIAAIPDSVKYDEGWKDGYRLGKYEGGRNACKQMEAEKKRTPSPALTKIVESITPEKLEKTKQEMEESEDERIRKYIAKIMGDLLWLGDEPFTKEQVLAYLEKQKEKEPFNVCEQCPYYKECPNYIEAQKEQKPVETPINWTGLTWKDIVELEGIINNVHYDFSAGIGQESFGKEVLERFRNKKADAEVDVCEQNPADDFEKWIDGWYKEHCSPKHGLIHMNEKEFKNWSRGIRNMFEPKLVEWNKTTINGEPISSENNAVDIPCTKWSEEDKEAFDMCIDAIPKAWKTKSGMLLTNWLKEHLRPYWKPSEEQMEALLSRLPIVRWSGDKVQNILESLYDDLKKLKED